MLIVVGLFRISTAHDATVRTERSRYSLGVTQVSFRNTALKVDVELNPQSRAATIQVPRWIRRPTALPAEPRQPRSSRSQLWRTASNSPPPSILDRATPRCTLSVKQTPKASAKFFSLLTVNYITERSHNHANTATIFAKNCVIVLPIRQLIGESNTFDRFRSSQD